VIQGVILENDTGYVFRSDKGFEIALRQKSNGKGSIVFRPQNVQFLKTGTIQKTGTTKFQGIVRHMEFHGNIVRYGVDVGGHLILIDETHQLGINLFDVDTSVQLQVNPKQIMFIQNQ
jgi:iron(III) transport system ATP-binding protein